MNKILLTGGAGFIGTHLIKKLLHTGGYKITIIDNLNKKNNKNFLDISSSDDKVSFYKEDVRNKKTISDIFNREGIDTCIHLAAKTSVPDSIINPDDTIDINVKGTLSLLEACSSNKVENFVFASSAAVYGEAKKLPLTEDHSLEPLSPYAASKIAGEALVLSYRNLRKVPNAISLRIFNVYGEGQSSEYAGVITRFAQRLSRGLPPIIYGDGKQTRDFISINDVVNAIILATQADKNTSDCVFNVGTGFPVTINELAQKMIRISGLHLEPIHYDANMGQIMHSYPNTTKSKRILKFIAREKFESGLKQMLKR